MAICYTGKWHTYYTHFGDEWYGAELMLSMNEYINIKSRTSMFFAYLYGDKIYVFKYVGLQAYVLVSVLIWFLVYQYVYETFRCYAIHYFCLCIHILYVLIWFVIKYYHWYYYWRLRTSSPILYVPLNICSNTFIVVFNFWCISILSLFLISFLLFPQYIFTYTKCMYINSANWVRCP